ncbi:MAG: hypothetical protein JWN45_2300 [Acidobacteriaceae bacterium]|nr:hypothetical protein [Acidobacteriaceae bacterium]
MPFARIITSTPALAKDVAQALRSSGYNVEVVSPANVSTTPVDLEIDLDLQNGIAWQPDQVPVLQETEHDYYADAPIEREFILAPAWRKLMSLLRENWERVHPQHAEPIDTEPNVHSPEEPVEPAPAPNVIEMPKAPRRNSPSILTTAIAKCQQQFGIAAAAARSLSSKAAANVSSNAASRSAQARARVEQLLTSFAARKHQPVAVTRTENTASLKPARDLSLVRQLWPVAAGIILAFLLGWTAATYNKLPAQTVAKPAATVSSITLYSQPGAKARARQQRAHGVAATPKPSAVRTVSNTSTADDEVVVRHYPARGVSARNQAAAAGPKHYSDLQ